MMTLTPIPGWKRLAYQAKQSATAQRMRRALVLHGPRDWPKWLADRRRRVIARYFHRDPDFAAAAYMLFNAGSSDYEENLAVDLFRRASTLGYLTWPRQLMGDIRGRDVLDIGCGTGVHGIGFVVAGAKCYTGVDPRIALDRDRVKDLRTGKWVAFGWTGADIVKRIPRIRLFTGRIEELSTDARFDVAALHNVTEHLMDLETALATVATYLREDGRLIFRHHNFYAWNGHHQPPKRVEDINWHDPQQRPFIDWGHLDFVPPQGHYFHRGLNKVKLHELRRIVERHYEIETWELIPSTPRLGAGRLTDEIRSRHPELCDLDFTTQAVLCRAVPRAPMS